MGSRRPETGWDAALVGGPFNLTSKPLLGPELLNEPPTQVLVYLCPCCGQVGILVPEDVRCHEIELVGGEPFVYRLTNQVVAATAKLATYVFPEEQEEPPPASITEAVMENRTVAA